MSLLEVRGLSAFHGTSQVLRDVSLSVAGGEVLCLLGRNGAGKTSTLRAIMGTLRPAGGQVLLDGTDLARLPADRVPGQGVAHVPQGRRLFADLTVRENLQIGTMAGHDPQARARALTLFPVLADRMNQRAGTLSGGEQTMLAVARAICMGPKVILMDEPTEGLMPQAVATIRDAVARLRAAGVAVVLVEQRIEAVLAIATRAAFMEGGRIVARHDAADLRADPALIARYLGV